MLLKEYRRKFHLTQEEVSKILGIPKKTYQNYEREVREADSDVLCRLADHYNISLDELVGRQAALQENEAVAREVDELIDVFHALDARSRAVLLDVARSLSVHLGEKE